jgi:plasmid maintenance system antidote protein VapI/Zn-dependent peptidase ImmA (M78 family)
MICFGDYLKDYLEARDISQSEFATRMGVTQKHMNEILNGKTGITIEMAGNIERLTGISSSFIIAIENRRKIEENLLQKYGSKEELSKKIKKQYCVNELKKKEWLKFKDETNIIQTCIDLLDFMRIKDFNVIPELENKTLFKKTGEDFAKLTLWIAHCDRITENQELNEYTSSNFNKLIEEIKEYAYMADNYDPAEIQKILNKYGIYFCEEKALAGTKVRGCFKLRGKKPTIYTTKNYQAKDSFFFELFHELGHCKSDYNEAQKKVIFEGSDEQENRADNFALDAMIPKNVWKKIEKDYSEENILNVSKQYRIPISFIVGRLANLNMISYRSKLYNENKLK